MVEKLKSVCLKIKELVMRIEDITPDKLAEVENKELHSLRLRFIQLWNKNFKDSDKDAVGTLERDDFLNKYTHLTQELKSRKLSYNAQDIDVAAFGKSMVKYQLGVDTANLEPLTIVPGFVSVSGSFVKNQKEAKDFDVVIRQDEQDTSMQLLLSRALEKVTKLDRHYIYHAKGPHSSYIPMYDLVLRPCPRSEIVVVKGGEGSGNFGHTGRPGEVEGSTSEGGVFYHGTIESRARKILKEGLTPGKFMNYDKELYEGDRKSVVFMSTDKKVAEYYANNSFEYSNPVILEIRVPRGKTLYKDMAPEYKKEGKGTSYFKVGKVPASWIVSAKFAGGPGAKTIYQKQEVEEEVQYIVIFVGPEDKEGVDKGVPSRSKEEDVDKDGSGNIDYDVDDEGKGVLQIHIMGIDEKDVDKLKNVAKEAYAARHSLKKLKMLLKGAIGDRAAHLDFRLVKKGDDFFEGGEIMIGNLSGLDKMSKLSSGSKLRFGWKVPHAEDPTAETIQGPISWMNAGKDKLEIFEPGAAGAFSNTYAAMLQLDSFDWKVEQADEHAKKFEVTGNTLLPVGVYLIAHVPVGDKERVWMISYLEKLERSMTVIPVEKDDEHIVYGIVYEPDTEDSQGDMADADEIKRACYYFMEHSQLFKVNHHGSRVNVVILENYIAPEAFEIDGKSISKGAWVMVVRVMDEDVWGKVKSGELTGFSMAGYAQAEELS
jgi:hypothetical protein